MRKALTIVAVLFLSSQAKESACFRGEYYNKADKACRPCRPGTWTDGTVLVKECEPCSPGSINTRWGSSRCDTCPEGTFSSADGTTCELCPVGTFSEYGAGQCTPCPAGQFSYKGSALCHSCPAATFAEHGTHCKMCPPGYSAPQASSKLSDCFQCPDGTIVPTGSAANGSFKEGTCSICPRGTYEVDNLSCEKCPERTITLSDGASGISQCISCPLGSPYEEKEGEEGECVACPPGTFDAADGVHCYYCPAGTTSLEAAGRKSECIPCPAGYVAKSGDMGCSICPQGTYEVDRTSCQKCPKGTISVEGSQKCVNSF